MSEHIEIPEVGPLEREPRPHTKRPHRGPRASVNPPGRSSYVPTEGHPKLVMMLRGAGVDLETIALMLKCSPTTVEKHFAHELAKGKQEVIARVGAKAVQKALAGDNTMIQFYLTRHGGEAWRTKTQLEHSGVDGGPLLPPSLVLTFLEPEGSDEQPPAD